ncbi:hypothetical protein F9282_19855 [Proteus terrae subsp. cibarius]|nr:hypothetical protein F9282_19855 [Proteus terrae subsp. cibarius]
MLKRRQKSVLKASSSLTHLSDFITIPHLSIIDAAIEVPVCLFIARLSVNAFAESVIILSR